MHIISAYVNTSFVVVGSNGPQHVAEKGIFLYKVT